RVFERQLGAVPLGQIRIHTLSVCIVVRAHFIGQSFHLLLCHLVPAESAEEGIRTDLRLTEKFAEAATGEMSTEVHFPEAILRVDEPLREEEIVGILGSNRRYAAFVSLNSDRPF